eukprot:3430255-Rhodomonas_salina.1
MQGSGSEGRAAPQACPEKCGVPCLLLGCGWRFFSLSTAWRSARAFSHLLLGLVRLCDQCFAAQRKTPSRRAKVKAGAWRKLMQEATVLGQLVLNVWFLGFDLEA